MPAWTDADEGAVLKIVNGMPTWVKEISLITFSIEGHDYQAEEGMTWYEWANSSYNTTDGYVYTEENVEYIYAAGIGIQIGKDVIVAG